jgi:hypothetical protein
MGWFTGPFGPVEDARWHLGELPSFNAWMVLDPAQDRAVVVLTNAGSQVPWPGANSVMSRLPTGILAVVEGQEPPTGMSLGRFYLWFDLAVIAIVATQAAALIRLLRRPAGWFRFGSALAPLAWELGLGVALLLGYPALVGFGWMGSMASMPDVTITLLLVATLWLATGLVRIARFSLGWRAHGAASVAPQPAPSTP